TCPVARADRQPEAGGSPENAAPACDQPVEADESCFDGLLTALCLHPCRRSIFDFDDRDSGFPPDAPRWTCSRHVFPPHCCGRHLAHPTGVMGSHRCSWSRPKMNNRYSFADGTSRYEIGGPPRRQPVCSSHVVGWYTINGS